MDDHKKGTVKLHALKYVIIKGELWWRSNEGVLLKCVDPHKAEDLLQAMHEAVCGVHYMAKNTTHKILRSRFWWPSIFKDAHFFVKKCDAC